MKNEDFDINKEYSFEAHASWTIIDCQSLLSNRKEEVKLLNGETNDDENLDPSKLFKIRIKQLLSHIESKYPKWIWLCNFNGDIELLDEIALYMKESNLYKKYRFCCNKSTAWIWVI